MNKKELVKAIVAKSEYEISDAAVNDIVNCFIDTVKETVAKGEEVQLVGFGTFKVGERAERKCINPTTKEEMIVPACKVPKFKPGSAFKDCVK